MSKVKIKGNASGTGVLTIEAPNTNDDSTITLPDGDVTLGVGIDDNATSTAITISSDENVGIGVVPESWHSSYPAVQFGAGGSLMAHSSEGDWASLNANMYNGTSSGDFYITSSNHATSYVQSDGVHTFKVAPSGTADSAISWTTAMQIENDGDIQIGADYSSTAANGNFQRFTGTGGISQFGVTGTNNLQQIQFFNGNGGVGGVWTNGSATSYSTSSDYRLKENVVPMTGSIDRLKELNPSRFNFKADADTTVDGFLAHEAQEVVPEAITGTKDAMMTEEYEVEPAVMDGETEVTPAVMGEREVEDYQGIDQSKLVPLLTSALQEAVAKIEDLEKRIEILEAK